MMRSGHSTRRPIVSALSTNRVRALNDAFRSTFTGGRIILAPELRSLDYNTRRTLLSEIRAYDAFEESDPHRDHEFGTVCAGGNRFNWLIIYYDETYERAAQNPADETTTRRVLSVSSAFH
jgi:hypothetical protein